MFRSLIPERWRRTQQTEHIVPEQSEIQTTQYSIIPGTPHCYLYDQFVKSDTGREFADIIMYDEDCCAAPYRLRKRRCARINGEYFIVFWNGYSFTDKRQYISFDEYFSEYPEMRERFLVMGAQLPTFHEEMRGKDAYPIMLEILKKVGHTQLVKKIEVDVAAYWGDMKSRDQKIKAERLKRKQEAALRQIKPIADEIVPKVNFLRMRRRVDKLTEFLSFPDSQLAFLLITMFFSAHFSEAEFQRIGDMPLKEFLGYLDPNVTWSESQDSQAIINK